MSTVPTRGARVLEYVVEEALAGRLGWRPIEGTLDQREALEALDRLASFRSRRVVQVVAIREGKAAAALEVVAPSLARMVADAEREIEEAPAERRPAMREALDHALGIGGHQLEDFPRPRGVTP